jgi:hypothetical protein
LYLKALKAQLSGSGITSTSDADAATELATYQAHMADYMVKASEERAKAVTRAETAEAALQQLQQDAALPTSPGVAANTKAAQTTETDEGNTAPGLMFYELGQQQSPLTVGANAASASGQWSQSELDRIRDGVYDGPGATLPPTVVSRDDDAVQQQVNPTTVTATTATENSEPSFSFYELGQPSQTQNTAGADAASRASGQWSQSEMDRIRDGVYEGPGATLSPNVASSPPQQQADPTTFAAQLGPS